ncbi:MAG: dihydroorotate dehydrogenase electron transfer subunit [Candidatus Omnitrophica bacterium]|nr:dihydroorotate dehydrogenase electron transfer subunit [Candidatus Omnitrophota bacterium]
MKMLSARIASRALPGQFLEVKVGDSNEPLLRRPFSIYRLDGAKVEILYEVLGKGTEILSQRKTGEYLDVIGPLGNGFNLIPNTYDLIPILVAGGMGVAPLLFLAEKLVETKHQTPNTKYLTLIGAKTKKQILCAEEFKKLGCVVKIATDDGSEGFKGKVTDLLRIVLRTTHSAQRKTLYACGPRPMLKEISRLSTKYNIPAQISLEEHMACGIGACLGCVVKTQQGYKRVCKEGPVFNADEIIWG